jgi:hypothetical protein
MNKLLKELYWEDGLNKTSSKIRLISDFCGIPFSVREYLILLGCRRLVKFYEKGNGEIIKKCPYCGSQIDGEQELCSCCSKRIYFHL